MHPDLKKNLGVSREPTRSSVGKIASKFSDNNNDVNKRNSNIVKANKGINTSNWQNTLRGSTPSTVKPVAARQSTKESKVTSRWQHANSHKSKTPPKVPTKTLAVRQRSADNVSKISSKWEPKSNESRTLKRVPLEKTITSQSVSDLTNKWQNRSMEEQTDTKKVASKTISKYQTSENTTVLTNRWQHSEPAEKRSSPIHRNKYQSASLTEIRTNEVSILNS